MGRKQRDPIVKKDNKQADEPIAEKYFVKKGAFIKRKYHIDGENMILTGGQEIEKALYFRFPEASRNLIVEVKK